MGACLSVCPHWKDLLEALTFYNPRSDGQGTQVLKEENILGFHYQTTV